MPWTYTGNFICDGVGFFIGEREHADDGLAFVHGFDAPIDAPLAAGGNIDGVFRGRWQFERLAIELQSHFHLLGSRQVVVDVGAEHDLIALDEEPRRLHAHDEILARDDLRRRLADARSLAHAPGADFPRREVLRHVELGFGDRRLCWFRATRPRAPCRRIRCGWSVGRVGAAGGCLPGGVSAGGAAWRCRRLRPLASRSASGLMGIAAAIGSRCHVAPKHKRFRAADSYSLGRRCRRYSASTHRRPLAEHAEVLHILLACAARDC